jgi:hypothetical protein
MATEAEGMHAPDIPADVAAFFNSPDAVMEPKVLEMIPLYGNECCPFSCC